MFRTFRDPRRGSGTYLSPQKSGLVGDLDVDVPHLLPLRRSWKMCPGMNHRTRRSHLVGVVSPLTHDSWKTETGRSSSGRSVYVRTHVSGWSLTVRSLEDREDSWDSVSLCSVSFNFVNFRVVNTEKFHRYLCIKSLDDKTKVHYTKLVPDTRDLSSTLLVSLFNLTFSCPIFLLTS